MTLHSAIEKLLRQTGRPMTTNEIAQELNLNKWYTKRDGTSISSSQIQLRTRNYSRLFSLQGNLVALEFGSSFVELTKNKPHGAKLDNALPTVFEEDLLMLQTNFKQASSIDHLVPDLSGIYCVRVNDSSRLPYPFNGILKTRNSNVIYIGIATKSLKKRLLNQELRARGHGTFFRSVGAILGYRPENGSLASKKNKKNYRFCGGDETRIKQWINATLLVNWVPFTGDFDNVEQMLIAKHLPLLNIAHNPEALPELIALRAECVRIANELS